MQTPKENEKIHILPNGRVYKVRNTLEAYKNGEYPSGGFLITTLFRLPDEWLFIDYSPDEESVTNYLKAAARLEQREPLKAKI